MFRQMFRIRSPLSVVDLTEWARAGRRLPPPFPAPASISRTLLFISLFIWGHLLTHASYKATSACQRFAPPAQPRTPQPRDPRPGGARPRDLPPIRLYSLSYIHFYALSYINWLPRSLSPLLQPAQAALTQRCRVFCSEVCRCPIHVRCL
jgi:hypothetical protein